jgi:hypothetical protein
MHRPVALAGLSTAGSGGGPGGARLHHSRRPAGRRSHPPDPGPHQKGAQRMVSMGINEAILEVIELTAGEALKNSVSVRTQLAKGLPLIQADRVQLQQVILNLIVNAFEALSLVSEGVRELVIRTGRDASNEVSSACGTRVRDWSRRALSASSTHSRRPSPAAWAWDIDLPFNHPSARRTDVGERERIQGRRLSPFLYYETG